MGALRAAGADRERLAGAALDLMALDPGHPEAEKAATAAGSAFRPQGRRGPPARAAGPTAAEQAGAERAPAFAEGVDLERQGDEALASGYAVVAARRFLEARNRFERARRSSR